MKFSLEANTNPFNFPLPDEVDIDPMFAARGTMLTLQAWEYPNGPFHDGVWKDYEAVVMGIRNTFKVSNDKGFEDIGALPILVIQFM